MTRRLLGRLTAIVLVAGLLAACTSERSDDDVAELTALDDPVAALDWLGDGDTVDVADREVSARLHGLVHDRWPDDGEAAGAVLVSALASSPPGEDRARLVAQLVHVVAHEGIGAGPVRTAFAAVLATHAADLRQALGEEGGTSDDDWTIDGEQTVLANLASETTTEALGVLHDDPVAGRIVLVGLVLERRGEVSSLATEAGSLDAFTDDPVLRTSLQDGGRSFGRTVDAVLAQTVEQDEAVSALATAVGVSATMDAGTTDADAIVEAAESAEPVPGTGSPAPILQAVVLDAFLTAGVLDARYAPPPPAVVTTPTPHLDPLLYDGAPETGEATEAFNSWLVGWSEPRAPLHVVDPETTGEAELSVG